MPIRVTVCYVAECDDCGDPFEGDYIMHFHSAIEAREHVENYDGAVFGDQVWCQSHIPTCTCGHSFSDHDPRDGPCDGCTCASFTPMEENDEASAANEV